MGYTALPFAVNIEAVKKAMGSKDTALFEKVKSSSLFEHYSSQAEGYNFEEILKDIIFNYIPPSERKEKKSFWGLFKSKPEVGLKPELAHEYGYALLCICGSLGEQLSPNVDIFYAGDEWKRANELFAEKGFKLNLDRMWETGKLFDIPDIADFPVISHYSKEEINYLLDALKSIEILEPKDNGSEDNFDELQELLFVFKKSLQTCKDKNVEWISFLH